MMQDRGGQQKKDGFDDHHENDIAISPIGIPLLCGPAMMTTAMIKTNEAQSSLAPTGMTIALLIGFLLAAGTTLITLLLADVISRVLGSNVIKVIVCLMGLLLMVIGVEVTMGGLTPIMRELLMP